MPVKLSLEGMDELRKALQSLPDDMKARADVIVTKYASAAKQQIQAGYPLGPTGNLRNRVTQTNNAARRATAVSIVKSNAPHAWIFEHGTVNRRNGKGQNRGRMPEADYSKRMIPKVIRLRAQMTNELIELVKEQGLEVSAS